MNPTSPLEQGITLGSFLLHKRSMGKGPESAGTAWHHSHTKVPMAEPYLTLWYPNWDTPPGVARRGGDSAPAICTIFLNVQGSHVVTGMRSYPLHTMTVTYHWGTLNSFSYSSFIDTFSQFVPSGRCQLCGQSLTKETSQYSWSPTGLGLRLWGQFGSWRRIIRMPLETF